MSAWRRKAMALFPEHRVQFARQDAELHDVLRDLDAEARDAHERYLLGHFDDSVLSTLRRIHGFAEWCLHQPELRDGVAVGFYEDLFGTISWESLAPWLSPYVVDQVEQTWAFGVQGEHAERFRRILADRQRHDYRDTMFATGEVERL